ncbi:MAG: hypothetical protein J1E43_04115 [Christensenellaceae bacterium]|nr:hypothetical protein [Christensenellaceae bacterium]
MRRIFLLLLALACLIFPAYADDTQIVDASATTSISMAASYLRITCPIDGEQPVTVLITDEWGNPQYQKYYDLCSGIFRSEDIYLRLDGSKTVYQVNVQAGDANYSFTAERVMPYLLGNEACSTGYPLSGLMGSGSWKSATILDVAALEGSSLTVPMHASGAYELGTVTFWVSNGDLKVTADIASGIDGRIDRSRIYVATNALQVQQFGNQNSFKGLMCMLDESISLGGTPYAAVLVELTVSFDPADVPGSPSVLQDGQDILWMLMQQSTANEAVG